MDNANIENTPKVKAKFGNKIWPLLAVLGGMLFALHNEFISGQIRQAQSLGVGLTVMVPYWIGELPIVLVYLAYKLSAPQESFAVYFRPGTSDLNWFNIMGVLLRCLLNHANLFMFYFVLVDIERSGVSLAVISCLFSLAAFFTAFLFLIIFGEALQPKHYIGMTLMAIAIVIIATNKPPLLLESRE